MRYVNYILIDLLIDWLVVIPPCYETACGLLHFRIFAIFKRVVFGPVFRIPWARHPRSRRKRRRRRATDCSRYSGDLRWWLSRRYRNRRRIYASCVTFILDRLTSAKSYRRHFITVYIRRTNSVTTACVPIKRKNEAGWRCTVDAVDLLPIVTAAITILLTVYLWSFRCVQ